MSRLVRQPPTRAYVPDRIGAIVTFCFSTLVWYRSGSTRLRRGVRMPALTRQNAITWALRARSEYALNAHRRGRSRYTSALPPQSHRYVPLRELQHHPRKLHISDMPTSRAIHGANLPALSRVTATAGIVTGSHDDSSSRPRSSPERCAKAHPREPDTRVPDANQPPCLRTTLNTGFALGVGTILEGIES